MIQFGTKAVKIVFVLLLLSLLTTPLFSDHNFSNQIERLSKIEQWKRLLHFKDNQSEIDDKKFFFAKDGKTNLKSELKSTIEKLILDKSDDENSTLCRYPSRSRWILEKIPRLKEKILIPKCIELKKEMKELGAKEITLILASAHMNSPASAFGHTFLRIDNNPNTPLLSYAVNYSAQTREENGFLYAYRGVFGGYKGRYSIDPYYKKIKEYSNLEQRDIWEYKLDLSKEEIERMVLHIFEIRHFYADYFFLTQNCSYNLLWLIQIAKEKSSLVHKFNRKTIPIDTVRAIIKEGWVKETLYRPSKRAEILASSRPIQNNKTALNFAKSEEYNLSKIERLSREERIASLELATALLQIRREKNEISKKEYLPKFLKILKSRSKLGKLVKNKTPQPFQPIKGHYSSKTILSTTDKKQFKARSKISYHDIYDNDRGYISGAYINFFDTAIEYKEKKLTLEEINILDIKSYAIQDDVFKPISWEVSLGGKRIFNNELNTFLKAGAGLTLGDENFYGYATITPTLYYKNHEALSLSGNIGLLYNPSKNFKFGVLGSDEWFSKGREIKEIEPFVTYSINQASALNFRYNYKNSDGINQSDAIFSLFWYY